MTVLVAEDDADQLSIRAMLLRQHGFNVVEADAYQSALHAVQAQQIECAVLDLRLPTEKAGLSLIRSLKTAQPNLTIYVLTGNRDLTRSSRPELALASEIFVKGSPIAPLLATLKALRSQLEDTILRQDSGVV